MDFNIGLLIGLIIGFTVCLILMKMLYNRRYLGVLYLDITGGNIKLHMKDYPDPKAKIAIFEIVSQSQIISGS